MTTSPTSSHRSLAVELHRDWQRLSHQPALVALARDWNVTHRRLDSLDDVLIAVGYQPTSGQTVTVPVDEADQALRRLVGVARDDQLAARVVLQRILPGLIAATRRWRRGITQLGIEPHMVLSELVTVAWDVIATYDTARRPARIASRLIRTSIDRAFIGPLRRRAATEQPHDPHTLITTPTVDHISACEELTQLLISANADPHADRRHLALICDLINAEGSTTAVARRHGVTDRTIRTRRTHATDHLRQLATAHTS